jgi:hypothetical protein
MLEYIAFYRRYRDLFTRTQDVADVALLRSYASITYNNARAQLSAILAEQALIEARVPFDLIFDEHLGDLSKYRVIVLPDAECLSDSQLASIRRFVETGGGLIATGQSGQYDEWRRARVKAGLEGLIDGQPRARGYEEHVGGMETSGQAVRKEVGQGRSVYLPGLHFDGPMPEMSNYFRIENRFWKRPKNWEDLANAINWAAKDNALLRMGGPQHLVANLVSQPEKRRMMLHLVNYGARQGTLTESVAVRCRTPQPVKEVRLYSPDMEQPQAITASNEATAVTFSVPPVKVYTIAVMTW